MKCLGTVFETIFRIGLGALFIWSSWFKIQDPSLFASSVEGYGLLPHCMIGLFSLAMPMLELLSGLALVATKWNREAALLVSGMLMMFIVALTQAAVRGLDISCGCFGDDAESGMASIVPALLRDVALFLPAVWLLFRTNRWLFAFRRSAHE